MKRKSILIFGILLTLCTLLLCFGCKKPEVTECKFGEWTVTKEATCTVEGERSRTCVDCGQVETVSIGTAPHAFGEWTVEKEPTCAYAGEQSHTCSVCGHTEKGTVGFVDHDFGHWYVSKPATVEEAGERTRECSGCGATETGKISPLGSNEAANFEELKKLSENGASEIVITDNIVMTDTVYVIAETTIVTNGDYTVKRGENFLGDLFVIGEDANGRNVILSGGRASLSLKPAEGKTLTFDGNKAEMKGDVCGSAFYVLNSSMLNLHEGVTLRDFKKLSNERTLDDDSDNATAGSEDISNANKVGGAAVTVINGVFNMYGGTITGCEVNLGDDKNIAESDRTEGYNDSSWGGAVYNRSTFNMYGGTIEECKAARGAAVYNYRTFNLYGGTVKNNYASVYGGMMYQANSQYACANLGSEGTQIKALIDSNSAEMSGGALFNQQLSSTMIYGCVEFVGNKSLTSNGGAINCAGDMIIEYAYFHGNVAASKGGAIYCYYADAEQEVRNMDIRGGLFENNEASRGGAMAFGASNSNMSTGANVKIGAAVFKNNKAFLTEAEDPSFIDNVDRDGVSREENGHGGAIYAFYKAKVTVSGAALFEGNVAEAKGGAIYGTTKGTSVKIIGTAENNVIFKSNVAASNGGAIHMYKDTTLSAAFATFEANEAHSTDYGGGALYFTGAEGELNDLTFKGNKSDYNAGALALYSSSDVTAKNITAEGNTATKHGGMICVNGSELTVDNLTLTGNTSVENGGAIYVKDGKMTVNNLTATENKSTKKGGVIYVTGGEITVNGGNVSKNLSEDDSGVASIHSNGKGTFNTVTFTENSAADHGGTLSAYSGGTVYIYGSTFVGNAAGTGNGGALYLYGGNAVVGDADNKNASTFKGNSAKLGGAIYVGVDKSITSDDKENALLTAYEIIACENTSTGGGGAIYVGTSGSKGATSTAIIEKLTANNNTVTESDKNGGALYIYLGATVKIGTLEVNGNEAGQYGGAIYASNKSQTEIGNVSASANKAGKSGGFLYATSSGTVFTILGGSASDNVAPTGGATAFINNADTKLNIKAGAFTYPEGTISVVDGFAITEIQ